MRKTFTIAILLLSSFSAAKAQNINLRQSAIDTIKTLDGLNNYLKTHPVISPVTPLKIDSPIFIFKDSLKNHLIVGNRFNFQITKTIAENMPVAKINSADRMPIVKLGDTENKHFTMLIKPVLSKSTKNPTP